jgi:hypothetical protein
VPKVYNEARRREKDRAAKHDGDKAVGVFNQWRKHALMRGIYAAKVYNSGYLNNRQIA